MTADIDQLLTTWVDAERTGDAEALGSLLTDDFVGIGPVGFVLDRAAWLARFDQGLQYEQLDLEAVSIRRHGDVGLVVAHQRAVGSHAGNPIPSDSRVSLTALPDGDGLRIAGVHYSFIGPPLGPGAMSSASPARAYRPSRQQRWANAVLAWLVARGRGPAFMRLLTVRGRVTGRQLTTPVVPVQRDGRVWVVSPFGDVAWVRNARAAGRLDLHRGHERVTYEVRELDPVEAVPVLRAYLSMPSERFVRRDFSVTATSSDDAIAAEATRHPVFDLTPVP